MVGGICWVRPGDAGARPGVFHRRSYEVKLREALIWTGVWVSVALLFGGGIYLGWVGPYNGAAERQQATLEFVSSYLIEVSLSVDNVFVFVASVTKP